MPSYDQPITATIHGPLLDAIQNSQHKLGIDGPVGSVNENAPFMSCEGPDGNPWIAYYAPSLVFGQGSLNQWGVHVWRYNGTAFVEVPGPRSDGAVSDFEDSLGGVNGYPVGPGGTINGFFGNTLPQICTDGTYVYVVHTRRASPGGIAVWQCDPGASYAWTQLTTIATITNCLLTASPSDVGHPHVAYILSGSTYVDRWSGSWSHVGGAAVTRAAADSATGQLSALFLDKSGQPHFLTQPSVTLATKTVGADMWMYSYRAGAWGRVAFDSAALGVTSDYRDLTGTTEILGPSGVSPVFDFGTAGKVLCFVRISKQRNTGLALADQPIGPRAYVFEFDCDANAFGAFLGDPAKGHVYTTIANQAVVSVPETDVFLTGWLLKPEDTDNRAWLWTDGNRLVVYDENCVGWHTTNRFYLGTPPDAAADIDTGHVRRPDTAGAVPGNRNTGSTGGANQPTRIGTKMWLPTRTWNGLDPFYERFQAEFYPGFTADRFNKAGGEQYPLTTPTFTCVRTNVAYDASVDPNGGRGLISGSGVTIATANQGTSLTIRVRYWCDPLATGHIGLFGNTLGFIGYVSVGVGFTPTGSWQEIDLATGFTSFTSEIFSIHGGLQSGSGGSLFLYLDYLDIFPDTDPWPADGMNSRSVVDYLVYELDIDEDHYACPSFFTIVSLSGLTYPFRTGDLRPSVAY